MKPKEYIGEPIIIEQTLDAPAGKVWEAITNKDQMKKWFFETIDSFKPEAGFKTQFTVFNNGKEYLHLWTVTEVVPEKRIVYTWQYGSYPGDSRVIWELSSKNTQTTLKLIHEGQGSFPQDNPDFTREAGIEGWNFFIRKGLKEFLAEEQNKL